MQEACAVEDVYVHIYI